MSLPVYLSGLSTGLSLIVAIGAQNAFVLRQGLRHEHVFWVCLVCALSDMALIQFGVAGFGHLAQLAPWLLPVMRYGGAAFLLLYGARSLWSAFRSTEALVVDGSTQGVSLVRTLLACLAITWLNPHVYLDTVVLLGSISAQFAGQATSFAAGAMTGSVLFFFALGYGAMWLKPVFARPIAWRVLDGAITLVMWGIALKLLLGT